MLAFSARKNCPGWRVEVNKIGPAIHAPAARGGNQASYSYNTFKLNWWNEQVQGAADGDRLLICDADLMVLGQLDPVWDYGFDVAYTVKRGITRLPLNAGVIFLRVNDRSRAWFRAWLHWNMKLLGNAVLHTHYWKTYAGMNQAALGALLENGGEKLARQLELRCEEWNCESATWDTYRAEAPPRIVHVKGVMRRALMDPSHYRVNSTPRGQIAAVWWDLEREAMKEGGRA